MNKKKLCATLTLSAFAASLLPGMAFAAEGDIKGTLSKTSVRVGNEVTFKITEENADGEYVAVNWTEPVIKIILNETGYNDASTFTITGNPAAGYKIIPTKETDLTDYTIKVSNNEATTSAALTVTGIEDGTITTDGSKVIFKAIDNSIEVNDKLFYIGDDKYATTPITSVGDEISTAGNIIVSGDFAINLAPGYYVFAPDNAGIANVNYAYHFTQEMKDAVVKAAKEEATANKAVVEAVAKAVGSDYAFGYIADQKVNVLGSINALDGVSTALNGKTLAIEKVTGALEKYVNVQVGDDNYGKATIIGSKGQLTSVATFKVKDGETVLGTFNVNLTANEVKDGIEEIIKAYIADNNLTDVSANKDTASVTLAKGDQLQIGKYSYNNSGTIVEKAITLSLVGFDLIDYFDVATGKVIAAPTKAVKGKIIVNFNDNSGKKITLDVTIEPGEPATELPPAEDLDTLPKEELEKVETLAIADKADKLAALEAAQTEMMAEFDAKGIKVTEIKNLKGTDLLAAYNIYKKGNPAKAAFNASVQYLKAVEDALKTAK